MRMRACLLIALLVSPAWSQEKAATDGPAPAAHSFDLRNETVRKIVRETAATQFSAVYVTDDATAPKPAKTEFVPAASVTEAETTTVRLPEPLPPSGGFLSTLIDTILFDDTFSDRELQEKALGCLSRENVKTAPERVENCPDYPGNHPSGLRDHIALKTPPSS